MASYEISGALIDGSFVNRTLPIGSYSGKLFVVAFESLHRNDTDTGENRIRGFKSTDGGHTWTAVGSTFRTEDGWFDAVADARYSDDHPYIHVTTNSTDRVFTYLRFNMQTETFDTTSGFHARRFLGFNRSYIGCNDIGEARILTAEGVITETPDHIFGTDEPPRFWTVNCDSGSVGGGSTVPGMTFAGNYAPMAVQPGPAGGAHPPGAQGWYHIFVKAEYVSGVYHQSTRWFDDGGAEHIFDDSNDARTRACFRHKTGEDPEPIILNFFPRFTEGEPDITGWSYGTEIISNAGGELLCDQSQIPATFIQGFHYTGGGVVLARAGTFYLAWMRSGTEIQYKTCPGAFTDCSSWTAAQTLADVLPTAGTTSIIGMLGGGSVSGGLGLLFCDFVDPSTVDQIFNVKFTLLPVSTDQQITGETGIPSAEDFGKTFGVSGDVVQCGTLNTDAIPNGCSNDTPILDEGGGNCQGFNGYSF